MRSTLIAILIANLFAIPAALAQDSGQGIRLFGSVGFGGRFIDERDTRDAAKLNEYRDLDDTAILQFDIKGRSRDYYFDAFGENIGRDDQYLDFKGGGYGVFKYQLYNDNLRHNWAFGAATPFAGVGSALLTATFPSVPTQTSNTQLAAFNTFANVDNWNRFDFSVKRKNTGGMFEIWNRGPWFLRADVNEVREEGIKLINGPNGTSPGNGFIEKPFPVDYKTQNYALEGGYASTRGQFALSVMHSRFANDNDLLRWNNGFMGNGLDTTTLAADNHYTRIGLNGVLKQLPWSSTLAGRATYSKTTNDIPVLGFALNPVSGAGTGAIVATNPDRTNFDGDIVHKTFSVTLHSSPSRQVDSRVYWYWFEKDNRSDHVRFSALPSGLTCGRVTLGSTVLDPGDCVTETLGYKKNNAGIELGYRFNPQNRLIAGFDYLDLERNRIDFDETKDRRYSLEYRNTALSELGVRAKYQYLERRSNFLQSDAGVSANDPHFLNRFIKRFDAADADQHLFKVMLDLQPAELWDVGLEAIVKNNKYKDTVLGRTEDDRQEIYASVAYGDLNKFRIIAFVDLEFIQYDSIHRNISTISSGSGTGINTLPSGFCNAAAPNCFDPSIPDTASNYNWGGKAKDRNQSFGIGIDWTPLDRFKLSASALYTKTTGSVDFEIPTTVPALTQVPIDNSDDTKKWSLNVKGTFNYNKQWDFTAGYAYERYRFSDIAYDGYRNTITGIPSASCGGDCTRAQTSYLTNIYAFPQYTANIVYVFATYKFE